MAALEHGIGPLFYVLYISLFCFMSLPDKRPGGPENAKFCDFHR